MKKVLFLAVVFGLVVTGFGDLTVVRTISVGGPGGLKGSAWSIDNDFYTCCGFLYKSKAGILINEGTDGIDIFSPDRSEHGDFPSFPYGTFPVIGKAYASFFLQGEDSIDFLYTAAGDSGISVCRQGWERILRTIKIPGGAKSIEPLWTNNNAMFVGGDSGIFLIENDKISWQYSLPFTERIILRHIMGISKPDRWIYVLHNRGRSISVFAKSWPETEYKLMNRIPAYTDHDTCGMDVSSDGSIIYYAGGSYPYLEIFKETKKDKEYSLLKTCDLYLGGLGGFNPYQCCFACGHADDIVVDHERGYVYILLTSILGSKCPDERVLVFNVKDISNPVLVDSLKLAPPMEAIYIQAGSVKRLLFQDSLLYIANFDRGVTIARGYGVGETTVESRQGHKVNESLQISDLTKNAQFPVKRPQVQFPQLVSI